MKSLFPLLLSISLIFSLNAQKKDRLSKLKPIDSLTKEMIQSSGLLTTYLDDANTLYLELTENVLNKDLLVVTRFAQLPANYSAYLNAGSKTAEQVVRFEKKANNIVLKQISFSNFADQNDPIALSVSENNFPPILATFPIKSSEKDRFLIDVSSHFLADSPGFNIVRKSEKEQFKMGSVDTKRSSIDQALSFPKNTEIIHTLTFKVNKKSRENPSGTFSFQINHSFIQLPEEPMKIRYEDERVGWFTLEKINYSSAALKADQYSIARRWRLEPKDKAAYFKGELVEPIKPIVYYLDPATPLKWRKYFKLGIEDWNSAFEKAGFKNAIIAKDPPSKDENPDFSPEDVRFSTVRYVASTTRNATGPSVSDPRTGEIIESDIIWYHNHLRSYRNRYLLETAAANPKARTLKTPEKEIGEMIRRVISHEVGHALGLPHNMKASSAYPVDSLRSGNFTQKYGIATTIMDYARYNYIAQPGDKNIRFIRQLGPYDDYSIEWGYRYFDETPSEEKLRLMKFVDEKSLNPMFMFGGYGNDPDSQTENIGDDPIKASEYGLRNLKIVAQNLKAWTLEPNDDFSDLEELYREMIGVYRRYIYHVLNIVGGIHQTRHNTNQLEEVTYKNVDKNKQRKALDFLKQNIWDTPTWLMNPEIVSEVKNEGSYTLIQNLQRSALNFLLSRKRLNRMLYTHNTLTGNGLEINDLFDHLFSDLFDKQDKNDVFERNLQLNLAQKIENLLADEKLNPTLKTDLYSLKLKVHKTAKQRMRTNKKMRSHYRYLKKITE